MMTKRIRLENLVPISHDRVTGVSRLGETLEYVCEACRHLVGQGDKFCWQCGGKLEQSELVEHYHKGEKLSEEDFNERRKLVQ